MKYVLLYDREQEHCISLLRHYCDIRSPVSSIAPSKLCTIALFLKDKERMIKNCDSVVRPNSILPKASHIVDGLWFVATQQIMTFAAVCPDKRRETLIVHPPVGMIKLNMSCATSSGYLTLLPYYHNESKSDIQDHFIEKLKNYNGSQIQILKPFVSVIPNFIKSDFPEMLKDTKEIPSRHLTMTIVNSRKSGRHPGLEWIFIAIIVISALTLLRLGLTLVFYIYKRSAKVSCRLARNRGKTTEAPVLYKAVPVYAGDKDVCMEEEISTQSAELDETNAVILIGVKQQQSQSKQTSTGVKQQPSQSKQTRSAFPALKLAGSTTSSAE